MASFPVLKCGAVAQYPADRSLSFSTRVLKFVDGSEQRFPLWGSQGKRWAIQLSLLDESEVEQVERFLAEQGGSAGVFTFTDPRDGGVYVNCSFEHDEVRGRYEGPGRGSVSVVIKENR